MQISLPLWHYWDWSVDLTSAQNDVFLCFIPMFHIYGLAFFALGLFCSGTTTVLMQKFEFHAMLHAIKAHKVNNIPAATSDTWASKVHKQSRVWVWVIFVEKGGLRGCTVEQRTGWWVQREVSMGGDKASIWTNRKLWSSDIFLCQTMMLKLVRGQQEGWFQASVLRWWILKLERLCHRIGKESCGWRALLLWKVIWEMWKLLQQQLILMGGCKPVIFVMLMGMDLFSLWIGLRSS